MSRVALGARRARRPGDGPRPRPVPRERCGAAPPAPGRRWCGQRRRAGCDRLRPPHAELLGRGLRVTGGPAGIDDAWDGLVHPHTDGLYLSFETDTRPARLLEAFPEPTLSRLRQVKRRFDPTNLFSSNFPIPPAEG
ncbi:BBE domain-containing protein [Oerskovia sp. M15]